MARPSACPGCGVRLSVAGVDNAEAVAFGVGEHHEVGILRIEIPVDTLGAKRHKSLHLGGLIGGITGVQIQVNARVGLQWGIAEIEGDLDARPSFRRNQDHPIVVLILGITGNVIEGPAPELRRALDVRDTQNNASHIQHVLILAPKPAARRTLLPQDMEHQKSKP